MPMQLSIILGIFLEVVPANGNNRIFILIANLEGEDLLINHFLVVELLDQEVALGVMMGR